MIKCIWAALVIAGAAILTPSFAPAAPDTINLKVAILGNPRVKVDWTEEQVKALADAGFNAVQLNIAWGSRPFGEALNFCDVVSIPGQPESPEVTARRTELLRRCDLAKKAGLRTIFHFGSPFMWRDPATGKIVRGKSDAFRANPPWFDILNPALVEYELALLKEFREKFPDVDDIEVYTYDQDAWQTSEFDNTLLSRGIPLHQRLPDYVKKLHEAWTSDRQGHGFWWEPWELSAGQIYKILPLLPRHNFGLMIHCNIAEAQIAMPADVWFKNTARMAKRLGMPVVAEAFWCSMTEENEPLSIPCPRLVDEQFHALTTVEGITGIKEYFGIVPLDPDLNLDLLRARLKDTSSSTDALLNRITTRFGPAQNEIRKMLDALSDATQIYPWDASWFAREFGTASIDHGWSAATIRGQMADTPSWQSTRRAHFMSTDDRQSHPWLLEDVQLRCEATVESLDRALSANLSALQKLQASADKKFFTQILTDTEKFRAVCRSYALHLRETNVAMLLRQDLQANRPFPPNLIEEMRTLLKEDAENQNNAGRVMQVKSLFETDLKKFLQTYLLPTDKSIIEKGHHTMTTR